MRLLPNLPVAAKLQRTLDENRLQEMWFSDAADIRHPSRRTR